MNNDITDSELKIKQLSYVYSWFTAIRLLTGGVNVYYAVDHDIPLNWFMVAVLTFSISSIITAYFLKKYHNYSSKKMVQTALICSIIYAILLGYDMNIVNLILANIVYGISLSVMEVSFFTWLSNSVSHYFNNQEDVTFYNNKYTHLSVSRGFTLALFTATVFPLIVYYMDWGLNVLFYLVAFLLLLVMYYVYQFESVDLANVEDNQEPENQQAENSTESKIKPNKFNFIIYVLLSCSFLYTMTLMPIYHLWQPFFSEKLQISMHDDRLIVWLTVINLLAFGSQALINKVPKSLYKSNLTIPFVYGVLAMLSYAGMIYMANKYAVIIAYLGVHGFLSVTNYSLKNYTMSYHNDNIKNILSDFHIISKVGSIIINTILITLVAGLPVLDIYSYFISVYIVATLIMVWAVFYNKRMLKSKN